MHGGYKKIILFLLAFVLAFSLAGCGSTEDAASSNTDKKIEKSEKKESAKQAKKADAEEETAKTAEETAATKASGEQTQATTAEASNAAENQATNTQTSNQTVSNTQATTSTKTQSTQSTQPQATQPAAPAQTQPSNPAPQHAVTISVIGPADHRNILGATKINIKEGDTVYDVLLKTGLQVEARNDYGSKYVEGIENIYEGDYPGQSGWTYKLNGVLLQMSAGKAVVKDGDKIVWEYVGG